MRVKLHFSAVSISFAGCCQKLLINHKENLTDAFQAQSMIFNIYEIKNHSINGKVYYASEDGTREIWYGTCGLWIVGDPSNRCVAFRQKIN